MRAKSLSLQVILAAAVLAVSAMPAAADVTRTLTLEMDARDAMAVENLAGSMTVVPGRGSLVSVTATIHAEDNDALERMRLEETTNEKGLPTLRVVYPIDDYSTFRYPGDREGGWMERWFGGDSNTNTKYAGRRVRVSTSSGVLMYADVEVQVPRGAKVHLRNVFGSLRAEDVEGDFEFDTANGEITLEDLSGGISADTGSGRIVADRISGEFFGDTGSGDIHLNDFRGDSISVDTGSGDIFVVSAVAREILADTGSGDIRVERSETGRFEGDTGSGDIFLEIDGRRLESVEADTGSGDITLVLGADASFDARADLSSGEVERRYRDAEAIYRGRELVGFRRGDGRARINVDMGSGDLIIKPGS